LVREWVDLAAQGLEILAVAIMVSFIAVGTALALLHFAKKSGGAYAVYRVVLGRTLQVGLELLVAADIIRTVSTPLTLTNLLLLGGLVLVRTFLGWTLTVEIEGHWPWQGARDTVPERALKVKLAVTGAAAQAASK
jgi:uncharacterized membrane protein